MRLARISSGDHRDRYRGRLVGESRWKSRQSNKSLVRPIAIAERSKELSERSTGATVRSLGNSDRQSLEQL
jgi:hypothetical protein